jgi:hypothetical protein
VQRGSVHGGSLVPGRMWSDCTPAVGEVNEG